MSKRKNKNKNKFLKLKKVGVVGLTAGKWLLEFLGEMIELMPSIETPYAYSRRLSGWPEEVSCRRIHEEVKRAKDRGWIIQAEKQGKKFIKLTEKGRMEVLYRKLQALMDDKGKKWDGGWWMALYDIPERGRKERRAICQALTAAGFCYLQKSVYVYPFELPKELTKYLKVTKLLPYIRFVHIDQMDNVPDLKVYFDLPYRPNRSKNKESSKRELTN